MLKVNNIKKSFNNKVVLNGVNLDIKQGEVYGLIGANGAGKTTLFNIIARVINSDDGVVIADDKEISLANDIAGKIGYILDIPAMYEYLTAYEYLEFIASPLKLSKEEILEKSDAVLNEVGLKDCGKKKIKTFSRGMKQRMGIASGLISDPKIILMDEPSSALDPMGRLDVLKIIENLKQKGKTIILSTHILNDIERICDRVGLLVNGKIVIEGKINDVLDKYSYNIFSVYVKESNFDIVIDIAKTSDYFASATKQKDCVDIEYLPGGKQEMFNLLGSIKLDCNGVIKKEQSIEQIFILASKENENV